MLRRGLASITLVALVSCAPRAARVTPAGLAALPEYPPPVPREAARPAAFAADPRAHSDDLEGSTWVGPDSDGTEWSFEFQRGGVLRWILSGTTNDKGTWKQDGSKVVMETNGHYADFTATIKGRKMTGSAHNTVGKSWTWVAERQR